MGALSQGTASASRLIAMLRCATPSRTGWSPSYDPPLVRSLAQALDVELGVCEGPSSAVRVVLPLDRDDELLRTGARRWSGRLVG